MSDVVMSSDEVPVLPAASTLVLRGQPLQVLMIRRHESSSFVPNAWVFPGGMVDPADEQIAQRRGTPETIDVMRIAAARELFEETGIWLGQPLHDPESSRLHLLAGNLSFGEILAEVPLDFSSLVWTSRWITPEGMPKRFDTWFFLVEAPQGAAPQVEDREAVELMWVTPEDALARHRTGSLEMVFPTVKNLEAIAGFEGPQELLASRAGIEITAMQPRLIVENGRKKIVL